MTDTTQQQVEAQRRRAEREARLQYEKSEDYAKWRRVHVAAERKFAEADERTNKQEFDLVQRALTAAIVIAGTIFVGGSLRGGQENLAAAALVSAAFVGLLILALRLSLLTLLECMRYASMLTTEFIISHRFRYRPGVRRSLASFIGVLLFFGIFTLGVLIGGQALNNSAAPAKIEEPIAL